MTKYQFKVYVDDFSIGEAVDETGKDEDTIDDEIDRVIALVAEHTNNLGDLILELDDETKTLTLIPKPETPKLERVESVPVPAKEPPSTPTLTPVLKKI